MQLTFPSRPPLTLDRPRLVGILNLTPDSFSDGGVYADVAAAVRHGVEMVQQGADMLDVGGESSRAGSQRVPADEQLRRVIPALRELRGAVGVPISIDTTRAQVAQAALAAGADMLNDISAGRDDPRMFELAARQGAPIVLMHMRGEPATMQQNPTYEDVTAQVLQYLLDRAAAAMEAGVPRKNILLDPGLGFGKTLEHNLQLLRDLPKFVQTGYPIFLGASRKRFIGEITGLAAAADRDSATAAVTALAVHAGVQLIRVHRIPPNRHAADLAHRIRFV